MHQLSGMLKNLGGFFIDNNNGTVTDKRTGLMWSIFHASLAGNSCVNHREALQYVNRLGTAGYRDWRVPSVEELQVILQTRPLFPADRSTFFWTSELFWHGWNEMAFIFSPHNNTEWKKESVGWKSAGRFWRSETRDPLKQDQSLREGVCFTADSISIYASTYPCCWRRRCC